MDRKSELKNCSNIKTILMIVIVLYHSMAMYMQGGWGPYYIEEKSIIFMYVAKWFNSFHVYCFTLISGYIFYYIKHEKGGYGEYTPFILNKTKRLIVPYTFISLVWCAPIHAYFYGTKDLLDKYLLGYAPSQLWFLLMLFWAFVFFWPISDLVDTNPVKGLIIVCGLYCIGVVAPDIFQIGTGLQYILYFYIGFLIRKSNILSSILYKIPLIVYATINIYIFICVEMLSKYSSLLIKVLIFGTNIALHIVGSISVFIILQKFLNKYPIRETGLITKLSPHSMVIYLIHQQFLYFSMGWCRGLKTPIIMVIVNFIFSISASVLISWFISKNKITNFLIGNK